MAKLTYKNNEGKIAGHLDTESGVYLKNVLRERHLIRMCSGYGIDDSIVKDLKTKGCKKIVIHEMDTKNILSVPFSEFEEKSFIKDFGYGEQHFIGGQYLANEE